MFAEDPFIHEYAETCLQTSFTPPEIQFDEDNLYVTDFDGIHETGKPLYRRTYEHFCDPDINSEIKIKPLNSLISLINRGEKYEGIFRKIRDYLRSKNFVRWQYIEGCKRAAEDWQPNEKAWYNMNRMKKRRYHPIVLSGSAQEALENVAIKIDFEKHEMLGTLFEFEEGDYGRLKDIHPMLGEEKLKQKRKMIGNQEHIAVTDDMHTDYMITDGAKFSIIVAQKDESILLNEKQLYIFDVGIIENFDEIFKTVVKCEYIYHRAKGISIDKLQRIIDFVKVLKTTDGKFDFLANLQYLRLELGQLDSVPKETVYQYEDDKTENQKKLKEVILATLKQLPEFVNIEAFERLVEKYGSG